MYTTIHYLKWMNGWMNEWIFSSWKDWSDPQQIRLTLALIYTPVDLDITTEELMLIKFIHAKFYANAIAIYNASKMNTHEFNKLLGFEAGAHSPFHTPTGSATWYVIQFRARTAILAAESRTQRMSVSPQGGAWQNRLNAESDILREKLRECGRVPSMSVPAVISKFRRE